MLSFLKGMFIRLLRACGGATWRWWQPRQLALGRMGAVRLESFSEMGLKSRACWVTERGDVCLSSLTLFCFTHIAVGPSICMADKVVKSRGKKKRRRTGNRNRTSCSFHQSDRVKVHGKM